jgi:hypothetical protein
MGIREKQDELLVVHLKLIDEYRRSVCVFCDDKQKVKRDCLLLRGGDVKSCKHMERTIVRRKPYLDKVKEVEDALFAPIKKDYTGERH